MMHLNAVLKLECNTNSYVLMKLEPHYCYTFYSSKKKRVYGIIQRTYFSSVGSIVASYSASFGCNQRFPLHPNEITNRRGLEKSPNPN